MAEVIKYGYILPSRLLDLLGQPPLTAHDSRVSAVVEMCIDLKRQVVEEDERETSGRRSILNFGHTVGHAIEAETGYSILHGQAVAVGMVVECRLGERLGITPPGTLARLCADLQANGLNSTHPALHAVERLIAWMRKDKKATGNGLAFSLLTRIGECKLVTGIDEATVRGALLNE